MGAILAACAVSFARCPALLSSASSKPVVAFRPRGPKKVRPTPPLLEKIALKRERRREGERERERERGEAIKPGPHVPTTSSSFSLPSSARPLLLAFSTWPNVAHTHTGKTAARPRQPPFPLPSLPRLPFPPPLLSKLAIKNVESDSLIQS